jgi:hypothetical protein
LGSESPIAIHGFDLVYETPFTVEYIESEGENDNGKIKLTCSWFDFETESCKKNVLKVDSSYMVYSYIDEKVLEINQPFSDFTDNSKMRSATGIFNLTFNLTTGEIINQKKIYLSNDNVVDAEFKKFCLKSNFEFTKIENFFSIWFDNTIIQNKLTI